MEGKYKDVISFGLTEDTLKHITEKEFESIRDYSIGIWKSFFKKQYPLIKLFDNPIEVVKKFDRKMNKFFIEYPRSNEGFIIGAFKENIPLATSQTIFRENGTALIIDDLGGIETSYGGAFQVIFKNLTGESFLEKSGNLSDNGLNFWILEKSYALNIKNRPELFLGHYIK
ncbi:MAG: hypothetical protein AAB917_01850 [Patescibacteria group bacterium]